MKNGVICKKCGFGYDADRFLSCPAVHNVPQTGTTETEWRLNSQRKEIEQLRDSALARNAAIAKLQAEKMALSETLNRTLETLEIYEGGPLTDSLHTRITALLARMVGNDGY